MLVGSILRESANRTPDRIALVGRNERITYARFDALSNQLANALVDEELGNGAKVAILAPNCPDYAVAYFGIARSGCVSVHLSTRSTVDEIAHVLDKTDVGLILVDAEYLDLIAAALTILDRTARVVLIGKDTDQKNDGEPVSLDDFLRGKPDTCPEVAIRDTDGLAITLTGGTTGLPKAVLVSHRARLASATASAREFGLGTDEVILASTPLFHTAGLFVWFATAVMLGATVVFPEKWDPPAFVDLVRAEGITAAFLVPTQLNHLVTHPDVDLSRLDSLRTICYAGSPMGVALYKRIKSALPGVILTENYGQSEACPITIRHEADGDEKLSTVGRPAFNAEISVVDANGNQLPAGQTGDIVTRGEQLFTEYYRDPEETAEAFRIGDGWLLTGDMGFLDEDGFLTLVDRSKDMLVSGGENVYPAEIENVLYQHSAVAECAVFGIPDDEWGEVAAAHVVLAAGEDVSESDLIDFCAGRLARFKRPRLVRFEESLPKTTVGKIRKNRLREPYWAGRERAI